MEVAQEVHAEGSETTLAKELDKLAHPTLLHRLQIFITDWHILLLPLLSVALHWLIVFPDYLVSAAVRFSEKGLFKIKSKVETVSGSMIEVELNLLNF